VKEGLRPGARGRLAKASPMGKVEVGSEAKEGSMDRLSTGSILMKEPSGAVEDRGGRGGGGGGSKFRKASGDEKAEIN